MARPAASQHLVYVEPAQVNGLRGQTSIQKRIEFDLYYIENWSLMLDLKILIRTALGGFLSKNAY